MADQFVHDGTGAVRRGPAGWRGLSPRELEVLEMASLGLTNGQVAERLSVSVHAIKFHLGTIYRKLGVANRTEAAVAYLRDSPERGVGSPS
jgi:DNA-binding CsgD family transcriptional regulator